MLELSGDVHEGPVRSAAFSPDGERVITASLKKAGVWRIDSLCRTAGCETSSDLGLRGRSALLRTLEGQREPVVTVGFNGTGQRVFTASLDGAVRIWDVDTGDTRRSSKDPRSSAAFARTRP